MESTDGMNTETTAVGRGNNRPDEMSPAITGRRRGPKTVEGKRRVAVNATKHGLWARTPVIPGIERREDWEAHRAKVLSAYAPADYVEEELADWVAYLWWCLHRSRRCETAWLTEAQDDAEAELWQRLYPLVGRMHLLSQHDGAVRTLGEAREVVARVRDNVERLRDGRTDWIFTADEARELLRAIAQVAKLSLGQVLLPDPLAHIERADFLGCSVSELREGIAAIGAKAGREPAELIEGARRFVQGGVRLLKDVERRAAPERRQLRMGRLLGRDDRMDRLARAETSVAKQLRQFMHELEARQARRRGERAPLARLDVEGLPTAD